MGISPSCGGGGRGAACLLLRKIFTADYVTAWACFLEASDLCIRYRDFMFSKSSYKVSSLLSCLRSRSTILTVWCHACCKSMRFLWIIAVPLYLSAIFQRARKCLPRQPCWGSILNNYRYPVLYRVYCRHMNTNIYKNIFLSELQTITIHFVVSI